MTTLTRSVATLLSALAAGCMLFPPAAAAYSDVYVFGDSLSDIGRVYEITAGRFPAPPFYAVGRFSNGPVAVEALTLDLTGRALSLSHDFAAGGARTGVSPFPNTPTSAPSDNNADELNGTGLLQQTQLFKTGLGATRADPNALYVVWAGANDLSQLQVLSNAGGTQWTRVIGNIETAIGNLAADGATHFFVPNVPNLGLTPGALAISPGAAAAASFLSGQFDTLLDASLATFDAAHPEFDIKLFDSYGFLTTVVADVHANGSFRGLTDVTSECQNRCADPATSLFWDNEHPTAAGHAVLAGAFAAALVPEPETDAMMIGGLGVLGWVARRRRRR